MPRNVTKLLLILCSSLMLNGLVPSMGPAQVAAPVGVDQENYRKVGAEQLAQKIGELEKPLYSPFIERFLLDEVKNLRVDQERLRTEMTEKLASSQLKVSDLAMTYVTDAVTYFFYLITGITTLMVIVGWTSLREIRSKAENLANKKISQVTADYERRLQHIEDELRQKSQRIAENHEEIEKTNEIHSLWLKASQETLPEAKIAIYDQILMIRPDDVEALTYKADAVLQLDEPVWALSLCNRALKYDPENANAYYQRACAEAKQGYVDDALKDLEKACALSEPYRDEAREDPAFDGLRELPAFMEIISKNPLVEDET
ncbi:TPR end-of-group domain-containing protein [Luteithermobacter gelatinilyticus]|uniref:TPR end-of-group domain-containing protein n=1 Tax=Luteithermobacter gelatinilyticus TaxID=2582913 RepID=UPI00110669F3|nr:tetratricopeptide repeat protein [Luteithermobacter gelatinilyticus]